MKRSTAVNSAQKGKVGKFFRNFFGVRMLKTALAVSLSVSLAIALDLKFPIMSGLAAVVTMTNSVFDSFKSSLDRLISTFIGFLIAAIIRQLGFTGFIPIFIGVLIIINICNYMNWNDATSLAIMVFVVVMLHTPSPPDYLSVWQYGINRLMDTSLGLLVGLLVNVLIAPPNQSEFIVRSYQGLLSLSEETFLQSINGEQVDHGRIIKSLNRINEELEKVKHDKGFSTKNGIKVSSLSRVNAKFYSLYGYLAQIADNDLTPPISQENEEAIQEYFGEDIQMPQSEECPLDLEANYNYQISACIRLLNELRAKTNKFNSRLEEN